MAYFQLFSGILILFGKYSDQGENRWVIKHLRRAALKSKTGKLRILSLDNPLPKAYC